MPTSIRPSIRRVAFDLGAVFLAMPSASQTAQDPAAAQAVTGDGLPAGQKLTLEEMTRIMDVAATLRKERALVDQQLNIDQIKVKLRERLLEAAKVSGDPVTAAEIDAAVASYYDQLHEFREPPAGFQTFLAHLWCLRRTLFKWLLGLAGVGAAIVAFSMVRQSQVNSRANALYEQSVAAEKSILQWEDAASLKAELEAKLVAARDAVEARDFATLDRIKSELATLQREFASQYDVVIFSSPNERSATERIWTDENGSRTSGFFVLVTARDKEGRGVEAPIHNRETDRTERVSRWGEQVPEAVFERLAADKKADGVLDEREFGVKREGKRELEVTLKGEDGQPITRGGQITSW
jgi:exonuclease VII small subunit